MAVSTRSLSVHTVLVGLSLAETSLVIGEGDEVFGGQGVPWERDGNRLRSPSSLRVLRSLRRLFVPGPVGAVLCLLKNLGFTLKFVCGLVSFGVGQDASVNGPSVTLSPEVGRPLSRRLSWREDSKVKDHRSSASIPRVPVPGETRGTSDFHRVNLQDTM